MLSKNQIKDIQSLRLKKIRDNKTLFIAEGTKTVTEIIEEKPGIIKTIYATRDFVNKYENKQGDFPFVLVDQEELQKISLQPAPSGALAICSYIESSGKGPDLTKETAFFLDDIRDPGNFGTIIRLLAWFGHSTLYCSISSCDLYNPKVIQSTMGAFLRIDVVYKNLPELLSEKKAQKVYGAVLNGRDVFLEKWSPGLIIIGNEANGISEENLELLTDKVTIPSGQSSGAESLNAAMAASIIAAEVFRNKS